ncbi:hypothetical protein E3N88_25976 [Mikania micrantha]|uniref:Uncharacterized protein n=1 Tax=Mikania micrantha TaxID=192012 RepID=A0A5N6N6S3_9ASTR|nr:hypothetical protein E3N88_25976 [Mikania micrantha]
MEDLALMANQNHRIQTLLLTENETRNSNKAPKLLTLDDYPHWKYRFEIHINGVDTNLWMMIEGGYLRPLNEDGTPMLVTRMTEPQRKLYDYEKKAYAILSQSIATYIFHQFRQFTSAKLLWDALQQRYEGNDALKSIKSKALRKEFNSFMYVGNESLDELIARFYHLLSELFNHEVKTTTQEKIQCLADALPPKWESFLMVLKQNQMMAHMDINDFIQKLKEQEIENKWKAKRVVQVQDPSLYYSTPTVDKSTTHAPLKTAFVSKTSEAPSAAQMHFSQSSSSSSQQEHYQPTANFMDGFRWWYYDGRTGEAVIVLCKDKKWETVRIFDPMWLTNLSHKDVQALFRNQIFFDVPDMVQALQFMRVIRLYSIFKIHAGVDWKAISEKYFKKDTSKS